ncbi:MAG: hypothetical protein KJO55_08890 [Gammaproteobacteria bacterium]|nr:hypothetical protein [Gammaproteobacteria bacterium]
MLIVTLALVASGCTTARHHQFEGIEYTQVYLADIAAIPAVQQVAATELADAYQRLAVAELMAELGRDEREIEHQAYMARQYAALALEMMELDAARIELATRLDQAPQREISPVPRLAGMTMMLKPRQVGATQAARELREYRVALRFDRRLSQPVAQVAGR